MSEHSPHAVDSDDLQRHAGYLRRLARGLLYDRGQADDIVQEAWLAALSDSGRAAVSGRTSRGWLTGVVKNLVAQAVRSDERRMRRERAVARPEVATPGTGLDRLEALERCVAAVRELEEPYRETLLLHYFDGLGARQIARRRGIPVDTVRTHVSRGLAKLRQRLGADLGQSLGGFVAALLPLAGAPPIGLPWYPVSPETAVLPWKGALFMSSKTALGVACAAFVGVAVLTWQMQSTDSGEDIQVSAPEEVAEVPEEPTTTPANLEVAPAPEEEERTVVSTGMLGSWHVTGLVLDADGAPRADVKVQAQVFAGDESGTLLEDEELVTDADGQFLWPLTEPEEEITVRLLAGKLAHWSFASVQSFEAGDAAPPMVVLTLFSNHSIIHGRVTSPSGEGIAGARVYTVNEETFTKEDGSYILKLQRHRGQYYLHAIGGGFAQKRQIVEAPSKGETESVDFELRPDFQIEGRVTDKAGDPVAGVTVTTFYTNDNEAVTDADGRYHLGHLDPGRPEHLLYGEKEGYVLVQVDVEVRSRKKAEQDLVISPGVRVSGRVLSESGAPLGGADLYIGSSPHAFNKVEAKSDENGSFLFPASPRGPQTLVAQFPGLAASSQQIDVPKERDALDGLEIVLAKGHFIGGEVLDHDGKAMEGISVSLRHNGDYVDNRTSTGEDGRFRLEALPPDNLSLELYARGIVRKTVRLESLDHEDLTITLERAGSLAGFVVDGASGDPIDNFRVRFVRPELAEGEERAWGYGATWSREGHIFNEAEGLWDSKGETLPPERYLGIEISSEGYAATTLRHVLVRVDPDPKALVIQMFPGAVVAGRVVDADTGAPLAGVTVKRYTEANPIDHTDSDDTHQRMQQATDEDGRFAFRFVPAGEMFLWVRHAEHSPLAVGPIEIRQGVDPADRLIRLETGAALTGRLLDSAGKPLPGNTVSVSTLGRTRTETLRWTEATDSEGHFRFQHLPFGKYRISHVYVSAQGTATNFNEELTISAGEAPEIVLRPPGALRLFGTLRPMTGLPGAIQVHASPVGPDGEPHEKVGSVERRATFTDANGNYVFDGLTVGEWAITVSRWEWTVSKRYTASGRVTLVPGAENRLDLEVSCTDER